MVVALAVAGVVLVLLALLVVVREVRRRTATGHRAFGEMSREDQAAYLDTIRDRPQDGAGRSTGTIESGGSGFGR